MMKYLGFVKNWNVYYDYDRACLHGINIKTGEEILAIENWTEKSFINYLKNQL